MKFYEIAKLLGLSFKSVSFVTITTIFGNSIALYQPKN
jgi:hypothetical protein